MTQAPIHPCVGCGYCCQKVQCVAGQSIYGLDEKGVCAGLKWDEQAEQYRCSLILETTGKANEAARTGLAIGAGCSSSLFNTQRDQQVVRLRRKNQ